MDQGRVGTGGRGGRRGVPGVRGVDDTVRELVRRLSGVSAPRRDEAVLPGADQGTDPDQAGDRPAAQHDRQSAAQGTGSAAGQVPEEWARCAGDAGGPADPAARGRGRR